MTITVTAVGSANNAAGNPSYATNVTSSAGDKIIVTCHWFSGSGGAGTPTATSLASTPAKTWTLDKFTTHGAGLGVGVAVYSWTSDGATLNPITFTCPSGSTPSGAVSILKVVSTNGTVTFDTATAATANDITSPFSTTAAAAISGSVIAIRADFIDTGTNTTWTGPAGYSVGSNNGNGTTNNVYSQWYKVGETGTPTITDSGTWTVNDAVQVFVTYQEPAASAAVYPVGPKQRQRRALPKPRTRHASTIPPQFNPPIPLRPVRPTRQMRGMPVRRGHLAAPLLPQFNPPILPPRPTQHRTWATLLRRGRRIQPVPPQQNPIIAPPVANQARRLRGWPVRRGRAVSPVPTQQAPPTNPPYATVGIQHRLWAGWLRRGRQGAPLPLQAVSPTVARRRPTPPTLRRGRRTGPVGYQDTPQPAQGHRAPRLWRQKPRQPQTVPAPTVVIPNPVLPTKTATIRRLAGWLLRRGRKAEQGWPQGVNLVIPDITYPTAFEVLADWHLDFDADPSGLGVELASSNLSFAADASGDTFTVDPSSQPFDLN